MRMALDLEWFIPDFLDDSVRTLLACSQHRRTALGYDAAWLAPGKLLVSADPMSTVRDPNPATCPSIAPAALAEDALDLGGVWIERCDDGECPSPLRAKLLTTDLAQSPQLTIPRWPTRTYSGCDMLSEENDDA